MENKDLVKNEDITILIVDDEKEVISEILHLVKWEGYNVISTESGEKAIEIVKNNKIDVILLDYFMPEITGEEVVTEIRKFNKEVVILLQTGYAGKKPPLEILENLDIQGYHDKTEGPKKLLVWVISCVKFSKMIRENAKLQKKLDEHGL